MSSVTYVQVMELIEDVTAGYWTIDDVRIEDVLSVVDEQTPEGRYPHAAGVEREVVVYDAADLGSVIEDPQKRMSLMAEVAHVLRAGPGVAMFRGAVAAGPVRRMTDTCTAIIAKEKQAFGRTGDHFAAGSNDRLWNALEKVAILDPATYVEYYESPAIALASEAWLGPAYQVTSQMNVVNPGGGSQNPHRDYHLGFMTDDRAERYPIHAHLLSPVLTLQGAVAHVDMPVESGPTKLLPHSHKYELGYLAWRNEDVMELFEERHVQMPLGIGDAVFFNPAVFHAAGANETADVKRMANLLQVSSAFGRSMETVDRARMTRAVFPELLSRVGQWSAEAIDRVIAATAEGYAFPTNLDRDMPADGLAPRSQADLLRDAVHGAWADGKLDAALVALEDRQRAH